MSRKVKSEKCGTCNKIVSENDKGVACEICLVWFHPKCQDISEQLYSILNQYDTIHWYCKGCNQGAEKVLGLVAQIQTRMDQIEKEFEGLKSSNAEVMKSIKEELEGVKDLLKKADDKVEELGKEQKGQPEPKWSEVVRREVGEQFRTVKGDVEKMQSEVVQTKKQLDERKDKENRENNIVIYNRVEQRTDSKVEWYKHEMDFCLELLNDVLETGITRDEIKKVIRLGKRGSSDKRPMLIQFGNKSAKNQVMQSLRKLKNAKKPFDELVVCHDLTKTEREECRKLVQVAKEEEMKDTSGEWIYRVRGEPSHMAVVKLVRK